MSSFFSIFIYLSRGLRHENKDIFDIAFDKAPHKAIINALSEYGFCGAPHKWFISFLTGCTQQVRIGESYSSSAQVVSRIIQGFMVGPALYTNFLDSLIRAIRLPSARYADNIKFIADVRLYSIAEVHAEFDMVIQWSNANYAPVSVDKCSVLHCGEHPDHNVHYIKGIVFKSIDNFKGLGVNRSVATSHAGHYQTHYQQVITKDVQVSELIRRIFWSKGKELLWLAFEIYVIPILMQYSPIWSPILNRKGQI